MVLTWRNTAIPVVAYITEEDALAIVVLLCRHPTTLTAGRLAPSESTSLRPRRDSGSFGLGRDTTFVDWQLI
jgi:hypothetical protein